MVFDARDADGVPIYHTNVLMCVATGFAMIGTGMIMDARRRDEVVARLQRSGRDIVHLSNAQIANFAGNAIELQGTKSRILALSTTALAALGDEHRDRGQRQDCRARYPHNRARRRLGAMHPCRHPSHAEELTF
jgi:hypothetical protein